MNKETFSFNYFCNQCNKSKHDQEDNGFVCHCGGTFELEKGYLPSGNNFDSYFDPTVKKYITSWKEQERFGREFVNEAHPQGLRLVEEFPEKVREYRNIRRNKLDYIRETVKHDTKGLSQPDNPKCSTRVYSFPK